MGKGEYKGENEYEQWRVLIIWEGEEWVILSLGIAQSDHRKHFVHDLENGLHDG